MSDTLPELAKVYVPADNEGDLDFALSQGQIQNLLGDAISEAEAATTAAITAYAEAPLEADAAEEGFRRVVQRKEIPSDIPVVALSLGDRPAIKLFELLVEAGLASSKSEARRLVQQGAVSVDRERRLDPTWLRESGEVLIQVWKLRFARVQIRS